MRWLNLTASFLNGPPYSSTSLPVAFKVTNPYSTEGAKTLAYEIAEQPDWEIPDNIVVPVGAGDNKKCYS
jgi:threonine synthase